MTQAIIQSDRERYAAALGVRVEDIQFNYSIRGFWAFDFKDKTRSVSAHWRSTEDFVWRVWDQQTRSVMIAFSPYFDVDIREAPYLPEFALAAITTLFDAEGRAWTDTLHEYGINVTSHQILEWELDYRERLQALRCSPSLVEAL